MIQRKYFWLLAGFAMISFQLTGGKDSREAMKSTVKLNDSSSNPNYNNNEPHTNSEFPSGPVTDTNTQNATIIHSTSPTAGPDAITSTPITSEPTPAPIVSGQPPSSEIDTNVTIQSSHQSDNQTQPILPAESDPSASAIREDSRRDREMNITAQESQQQTPTTDENVTMVPKPSNDSNPVAVAIQEDSRHDREMNITAQEAEQQQQRLPIDENATLVPQISIDNSPKAASQAEDLSHQLSPQEELLLPIEENSTISSDVVKIWHDTDSKEICVVLKEDTRCPHPSLLGRLSGPGLAILEWKERQSTGGTVLCGGYSHYWLDAGDYFVEILILYCNDFGVNALARYNNTNAWMEFDAKFSCVEDVLRNRITAKDEGRSIIHIPTKTEGRGSYRLGRWIRKSGIASRPLYVRVQTKECGGKAFGQKPIERGSSLDTYCRELVGRDNTGSEEGQNATGLYEYEFQWWHHRSDEELIEKFRDRLHNKITFPKICAVGDSHSAFITKYTLPNLNLTGLFEFVENPWPRARGGNWKGKMNKYKCDICFVQVSQWPSSYIAGDKPFPYAEYHAKLKEHVESILIANPRATVYLPTADQNPLMARVAVCEDWRAPTFMDGRSHVHQMIVNELNTSQVKYLDTNFIIYTHWDGHSDWQHLMEIVRKYKTLYVAAVMFGEREWLE